MITNVYRELTNGMWTRVCLRHGTITHRQLGEGFDAEAVAGGQPMPLRELLHLTQLAAKKESAPFLAAHLPLLLLRERLKLLVQQVEVNLLTFRALAQFLHHVGVGDPVVDLPTPRKRRRSSVPGILSADFSLGVRRNSNSSLNCQSSAPAHSREERATKLR